jgi:hypothetical protein
MSEVVFIHHITEQDFKNAAYWACRTLAEQRWSRWEFEERRFYVLEVVEERNFSLSPASCKVKWITIYRCKGSCDNLCRDAAFAALVKQSRRLSGPLIRYFPGEMIKTGRKKLRQNSGVIAYLLFWQCCNRLPTGALKEKNKVVVKVPCLLHLST